MRKLFIFIPVIFACLFFAGIASAATQITLNNVGESYIYPSEFDQLVLDFNISAASDNLQALTVKNLGLARDSYEITKLTLWQDDGNNVFDGLGVDKNLGDATFDNGNSYWYWQNLNVAVSVQKHFYVSIETNASVYITRNTSVQMEIPAYFDLTGNGIFALGDTGIFMSSKNNGPASDLVNTSTQTIIKQTADGFAPKTVITDPLASQSIATSSYKIKGLSRDQGGSVTAEVDIYINNILAGMANPTGTNFLTWDFAWQNITAGTYSIYAISKDGVGNQAQTAAFNVTVAFSTPVVPPVTPPTTITPIAGLSFGDLIKGSGQAVYYYGADGKRYVFPNEKTYKTWYADFSTVKTISDTNLASIMIGGNVTYRPGVKLVKITTDPKVYAVSAGGILRWITTESLAVSLYGANWTSLVEDVPDSFFVNYNIGANIVSASDYSPSAQISAATSINVDKRLNRTTY